MEILGLPIGETKFNLSTLGEVDLAARLLKESTKQISQWTGLSIRLRGYSCNANATKAFD